MDPMGYVFFFRQKSENHGFLRFSSGKNPDNHGFSLKKMFRGSLWGTYPTIWKDPGDFTAGGDDILPVGI
jgi:hypothetical protein